MTPPLDPAVTPYPLDPIKISKAAKLCCVHPSTFWRWVLRGRLRSWQVGGQRRVSHAETLALFRELRADTPIRRVRTASDERTRRMLIAQGLINVPAN